MKYAKADGKNTEATPKARAVCLCCGETLISKCGSVKIWHWSHFPKRHCDKWWENETEWHRNWKNLFPRENQEVVLFDEVTGEKHIADVKTKDGLVIELQNSPMTESELVSRENFYKNMVWVVNGTNFLKQFVVFPFTLPPPDSDLAKDLHILRQPFLVTNKNASHYNVIDKEGRKFFKPILVRKSKGTKYSGVVTYEIMTVSPKQTIDTTADLQSEIDIIYEGHHFFDWKNRREVWFKSVKNVFIDFGGQLICQLCSFDKETYCIKLIDKAKFITNNGGNI